MFAAHALGQEFVHQARHVRRVGYQFGQALAELVAQGRRAVAFAQDLFQHRPRFRPDVELGIEQAAHALDVEQGFLQQDQLRLQGQFVALGGLEQLHQHLAQRDFAQRPGEVGLADRTRGRFEFIDAHRRRHPAGFDVQFGDAAVVALEDRHEVFGQVVLVAARQLADDAEINRDVARVVLARRVQVHPDVAGVGVGVEEVVAEHLRVEHAHAAGGECLAVDAGGVERLDVVGRNAAHAFHREHAFAAVAPEHLGHVQLVAAGPGAAHQAAVGAFALQVEFGVERGFDFAHHFLRPDLVGRGVVAVGQRGQGAQQGDVVADALADAGAQHLHHHLAAVVQARGVHLGDGSGRERGVFEFGVQGVDGLAQAGFDALARQFAREGRDAVLQQRQFFGHVRRQQVAARGQHLAELHEDRAQFLQGQAQALAARQVGVAGAARDRLEQPQPAANRGAFKQ